jgi:hypothetical protein
MFSFQGNVLFGDCIDALREVDVAFFLLHRHMPALEVVCCWHGRFWLGGAGLICSSLHYGL